MRRTAGMVKRMKTTFRMLEAVSFGARAHAGNTRSDGETPYHAHPMRVALLVAGWGCDDETTLIAALLHDVIENSTTDYDDIAEEFGNGVADCVVQLTRDYRLPHELQEAVYYEALAKADWRVRLVKLADGYDNVMDVGVEKVPKAKKTLELLGKGDEPPLVRAHEALTELIKRMSPATGLRTDVI
ncbi:MAG: rsh [Rariglobus sp.]|jgi:guanosine-3',5'-bis(diphosphate) 3'-pyrophosphohydrolase|nr:rsh [Rariglobus sp.]